MTDVSTSLSIWQQDNEHGCCATLCKLFRDFACRRKSRRPFVGRDARVSEADSRLGGRGAETFGTGYPAVVLSFTSQISDPSLFTSDAGLSHKLDHVCLSRQSKSVHVACNPKDAPKGNIPVVPSFAVTLSTILPVITTFTVTSLSCLFHTRRGQSVSTTEPSETYFLCTVRANR